MRHLLLLLCALSLLGCRLHRVLPDDEVFNTYAFWVGTYTGDTGSEGIYRYQIRNDGRLSAIGLAAPSANPSFLAYGPRKRHLVAVNEEETGRVSAFRIEGNTLLLQSQSSSGGAHPCHVTVDSARNVLVSNYTGGNVGYLRMDKQGKLSPLLDTRETATERPSHAHATYTDRRSGRQLTVDLGTDALWASHADAKASKLRPAKIPTTALVPGAGPRHAAFHPNRKWLYVINEYANSVTRLRRKPGGGWKLGPSVSTLPPGFAGESFCADIHISADGRFLYGSNRGHNSIAVFEIDPDSGDLRLLELEPTRGDWPRNFAISPDGQFLLVANQRGNNIVAFYRDRETGRLEYLSKTRAPAPVCLLF